MPRKVRIPQPIPEVAVNRLKNVAGVEVLPHIDRVISRRELLKLAKGKNDLYGPAEIPFPAGVIDTALPDLKGIAAMTMVPLSPFSQTPRNARLPWQREGRRNLVSDVQTMMSRFAMEIQA